MARKWPYLNKYTNPSVHSPPTVGRLDQQTPKLLPRLLYLTSLKNVFHRLTRGFVFVNHDLNTFENKSLFGLGDIFSAFYYNKTEKRLPNRQDYCPAFYVSKRLLNILVIEGEVPHEY